MARASTRTDSSSNRAAEIFTPPLVSALSISMKRNLASTHYVDPISHDGVHDALTFLPAPAYFYEYLYREIAIIERSREPLTLIRLLVEPADINAPKSDYEISIINFTKALNRCIRRSDLAARIGRYEFVLAISSHHKEADDFAERLVTIWRDSDFTFSYSSTKYIEGDGAMTILDRLDQAPQIAALTLYSQ